MMLMHHLRGGVGRITQCERYDMISVYLNTIKFLKWHNMLMFYMTQECHHILYWQNMTHIKCLEESSGVRFKSNKNNNNSSNNNTTQSSCQVCVCSVWCAEQNNQNNNLLWMYLRVSSTLDVAMRVYFVWRLFVLY